MTSPRLITTARVLEAWSTSCHDAGETIAIVPTMGNLHEGHLSLIELASQNASRVVVSVFVNPTQFSQGEDFERYPRSLDQDIDLLHTTAADVVFSPSVEEMYPPGRDSESIDPGLIGSVLEGAIRPGHFAGVLQVCHRLFELSRADVAVFGEKDAQQLFLVTQMAQSLQLPIQVIPGPTLRAPDGLALSSRNSYLSPDEREAALALPAALNRLKSALEAGAEPDAVVSSARLSLAGNQDVELDYLELVSAETFEHMTPTESDVIVVGAITVGGTRLIDNLRVQLPR
jgi:pantoate--beta-alanine ligase